MPDELTEWLAKLGLGQYASNFTKNDIDTKLLTELTNDDLKELGVSLKSSRAVSVSTSIL